MSVDTKRYDKRIFLQEILKDKLSVYGMPVKNYKEGIKSDVFPYDSGFFTLIYIKKADASAMMITVLGLEGFIQDQRAADYLSNCPMTIEHMRSQEGSINPVELANFYNANCD